LTEYYPPQDLLMVESKDREKIGRFPVVFRSAVGPIPVQPGLFIGQGHRAALTPAPYQARNDCLRSEVSA
jgi:hypothetical protein